jgi:peptide deformylase
METIAVTLDIVKIDQAADILRAQSVDAELNDEIRDLCTKMITTMYEANGVGLAAPQVGKNLNIFVMRTTYGIENDINEHLVLINPRTVKQSGTPVVGVEGCLSIPGLIGEVKRFPTIQCAYTDENGVTHEKTFTDMEARIYQHENDHLNGILFLDRAERFRKVQLRNDKI